MAALVPAVEAELERLAASEVITVMTHRIYGMI